jgi:hypothetical protein
MRSLLPQGGPFSWPSPPLSRRELCMERELGSNATSPFFAEILGNGNRPSRLSRPAELACVHADTASAIASHDFISQK